MTQFALRHKNGRMSGGTCPSASTKAARAGSGAQKILASLPPDRAFAILAQDVVEGFGHEPLKAEAVLASTNMHGERHLGREVGGDGFMREVVNALLYIASSGCPWRMLPQISSGLGTILAPRELLLWLITLLAELRRFDQPWTAIQLVVEVTDQLRVRLWQKCLACLVQLGRVGGLIGHAVEPDIRAAPAKSITLGMRKSTLSTTTTSIRPLATGTPTRSALRPLNLDGPPPDGIANRPRPFLQARCQKCERRS